MTGTLVQSPLRAEDLGVRFRRGWALRHCSLRLREGRITALVGPNGAGKSTLMSVAAGLRPATEGFVEVQGDRVGTRAIHPAVGFLAQDKPLYKRRTVDQMVVMATHLNPGFDRALVRRLITEADLPGDARVGTLSGGQRSRLALALALGRRPAVLILDEPLADLDPLARFEMQQMLLTEAMDTGMTVLLSSHIVGEIQDSCDDLIILRDGGVVLDGAVDELTDRFHTLIGPGTVATARPDGASSLPPWIPGDRAIDVRALPRQTTVLVDGPVDGRPADWSDEPATLDEIVMAYLRAPARRASTGEAAR